MIVLLLAGFAFADEPAEIEFLPEGVTIKVTQESFLVPEPMFDKMLLATQNLPVCNAALTKCTADASSALQESWDALKAAQDQFAVDAALAEDLTQRALLLTEEKLVLQDKLGKIKQQRNVAWAVAGGLVLGSVSISVAALAL